jgi:hypothetical protein
MTLFGHAWVVTKTFVNGKRISDLMARASRRRSSTQSCGAIDTARRQAPTIPRDLEDSFSVSMPHHKHAILVHVGLGWLLDLKQCAEELGLERSLL